MLDLKHSEDIKLAVIPGDGIGPEVIEQSIFILKELISKYSNLKLKIKYYDLGARFWHKYGKVIDGEIIEEIKKNYDAVLLGAIGDPSVPPGLLERNLLLRLRFEFDHYVNIRPCKIYSKLISPLKNIDNIDFIVIREGTEGLYTGAGGNIRKGTLNEVATEISINTAFGVKRLIYYACNLARKLRKKRITLVHKKNVLKYSGNLWQNCLDEISYSYPDLYFDYLHIDTATMYLVEQPEYFDIIVTDNLFGDIITDLSASIVGGIGLAASGSINPERKFPSIFEPVHGSAPDIAGTNTANPIAAILSLKIMLNHLGYINLGNRIDKAVNKYLNLQHSNLANLQKNIVNTKQIASEIINLL